MIEERGPKNAQTHTGQSHSHVSYLLQPLLPVEDANPATPQCPVASSRDAILLPIQAAATFSGGGRPRPPSRGSLCSSHRRGVIKRRLTEKHVITQIF